ncbi:hypothetical protein V6N13_088084 [Hibiscus sabdariffa]
MASDSGVPQVHVISVLEEVLQQHGTRLDDIPSSRTAEEASLKRNEATGWLRKTVGVVLGKDLPAMPSEDEFRLGLRSGKILCTALNKIEPGSVPKIVEGPDDSVIIPDGAALSEYPFIENVTNFLNVIEELGIPPFEATDLEQCGKSSRIVQCVLALKSYSEWKKSGAIGTWRYIESPKPPISFRPVKPFTRRNSEPYINYSLSRTVLLGNKSMDGLDSEQSDLSDMIVESMITKVSEEYERRLASHSELSKTSSKDMEESLPNNLLSRTVSCDDDKVEVEVETPAAEETVEDETSTETEKKELSNEECKELPNEECKELTNNECKELTNDECKELPNEECKEPPSEECNTDEESKRNLLKQKTMVEQQQQYILELKHSLHETKVGMDHLQMMYHEEFNNLGKQLHSLTYAASGYQRVLEENRKLYNQVQDLKGNIRVYCRVRPQFGAQLNSLSCVDNIDDRTITVLAPTKNGKEGRKSFTFNKIFSPSATQAEVFSDTQPLIRSVLDGFNVCIFAYGQTGSGKTHTMSGPKELTEEGLGVNYRALGDLFELSNQRKETISYEISVQMLEIYNEQVKDLLATDSTSVTALKVGLTYPMQTFCLTVHVQGKDLTSGNVLHASMHLVDLAGSERVDKSEVTGDRLKEAQHINKSLAALGDVIASLASKSSHVPYRNSKLTQLLQDSLGGQAKTLMFVHIAPEYEAHGETLSTLKFAERVATVELGAAKANKDGAEVKELKDQIASLKAALAAAKKEGEPEQVQQSQSIPTSPEAKTLSLETSPSLPKCDSPIDQSSSVTNAENESSTPSQNESSTTSRNESLTSSRRGSLELQEMLANPSLWPPLEVVRSAGSAKADVKPVVNKQDKKDRNAAVGNVRRSPTKVYPEQNLKKPTANKKGNQENDQQRVRSEVASTDDSSDIDAVTSDCSETDSVCQSSIPKTKNGSNGLAPKPKKQQQSRPPSPANSKNIESKSTIPSQLPSPANRKPSNGANPNANKPKRKTGSAK